MDISLGSIRLASASQPNPPNLHKMVELAIRFERDIFEKSQDKVRDGNSSCCLVQDSRLTVTGDVQA